MSFAEKDFQTLFNKWVVRHEYLFYTTTNFELKISKKDYINFKEVKAHQSRSLLSAARPSGLIYKLPDVGFDQKPFDCTYWKEAPGYIAILYYIPRKQKDFVLIEVDEFVAEMERSKRKSLTKERACDIGIVYNVNE